MTVRLVPLDANFDSFGPFIVEQFTLVAVRGGKFTAVLKDGSVLDLPLPAGTMYAVQVKETDEH